VGESTQRALSQTGVTIHEIPRITRTKLDVFGVIRVIWFLVVRVMRVDRATLVSVMTFPSKLNTSGLVPYLLTATGLLFLSFSFRRFWFSF
jgi:hypothetical protein